MDSALGPLDLVEYSAQREKAQEKFPSLDINELDVDLKEVLQKAADLINSDFKKEFLYKNPNGWQLQDKKYDSMEIVQQKCDFTVYQSVRFAKEDLKSYSSSKSIRFTFPNCSTSSEEDENHLVPWCKIEKFEISRVVQQINEFIQTWELSPATKFVVIALDKIENIPPFGERFFAEAHFSKPTPKCPNPLAVAKVYFHINISKLLPSEYPVNVTYKFEGYKTQYYAMGELKLSSNKFQRYFIDTILHMKLAFYAELYECRHPLNPLKNI